jgi:creatinine amidohydrolase
MEREMQKLTWTAIKKLVPDTINTVLLPVGTVEAHGASAIGTDNYIPEAIARLQAKRLNALIAPTLPYGITRSLYRYPGSITIQPKNYGPFVADVLESLADHGFRHLIVLNGHGGNNNVLKEAAYDVHYRRQVYIAVIHWWQLVSDVTKEHFGQVGGHGGIDETACMQAIDPALVNKGEYTEKMAFQMTGGADVFPVPGSILIYTEGEGFPNFDLEQARTYLPKVANAVGDFVLSVIDRWKQIDM